MTDDASQIKPPPSPARGDKGNKQIIALIMAAGRGHRARNKTSKTESRQAQRPKQYCEIMTENGMEMVLRQTLRRFALHPQITAVQALIHPDDMDLYQQAAKDLPNCRPPVFGGASRADSVRCGFAALATSSPKPAYVLIHDGVRPYVQDSIITNIIAALAQADGAVPAVAMVDTVKQCTDGKITATLPRDQLVQAQTPQGFHYDKITRAYAEVDIENAKLTDDAAIAEAAGLSVMLTAGDRQNIKLTTEQDFIHAQGAENISPSRFETRTGFGFDVHRFTAGDHVMLGGVKIPHTHALQGHSDADVGLHALTDALLGALAEGDIGQHFPPSDKAHKGRDSADFLEFASTLLTRKNARITHLDLTFICETPKLAPHCAAIRTRIADIVAIDPNRVSVKATTTEGLGFTGRKEGIAAQAVASVEIPRM